MGTTLCVIFPGAKTIQFGLCTFTKSNDYEYIARPFNFYVFPKVGDVRPCFDAILGTPLIADGYLFVCDPLHGQALPSESRLHFPLFGFLAAFPGQQQIRF